jgi:hypothetical protein
LTRSDPQSKKHGALSATRSLVEAALMDDRSYADLRREYEAQHRALVEAQHAWIATGELRDKAEAEIERLREEVAALRLIYPEGTADKIAFLEDDHKRLRELLRRARQALRSLDEISDEEIGALVCELDTRI